MTEKLSRQRIKELRRVQDAKLYPPPRPMRLVPVPVPSETAAPFAKETLPMSDVMREDIYLRDRRVMTSRQWRRWYHKHNHQIASA